MYAGVLAALAVFALDVMLPRGLASGALHVLPLLLLLRSAVPWHVPALAGLCTLLLLLDVPLSPPGAGFDVTLENRVISLVALWVAAGLLVLHRREAQRARDAELRASELFRVALDAAPDAMFVVDAADRVTFANRTAAGMFGYTAAELVGLPLGTIMACKQPQGPAAQARAGEQRKPPRAPDVTVARCKDGKEIPLECICSAIDNGEPLTLIAARDVSERVSFEERLRATQRLEAIGRLAGGVAHDFNNLLAVILSYARFIEEGVTAARPVHDDVREVVAAAERASTLTKQLLAFSRRQIIEPRLVSLPELMVNITRMLERLVGEDVQILVVPAADLWPVKVDPGQVEQVVMNLAINARHAMPSGGKLTIELGNTVLDAAYCATHPDVEAGEYVLLAVTDTGTGMTAEVRARAFEPFFTTKPVGEGSGLGLSTVYGIVKQASGHVWLYSELGKGTTVKVYLPRACGDAQPLPAPAAALTPRGGNETILVVEDEAAVRQMLVRVLRGAGYTVLEAANGLDALQKSEAFAGFALLVTDVVMPQMGGRELARELLRRRPALRVLYMSGYTENAIVHHGTLDVGLVFLQKPFRPEDLLRRVRDLLDAPGSSG